MDPTIPDSEENTEISFENPIANFIYGEQLRLFSLSKGYFCLSFEKSDSQYLALEFMLKDPEASCKWLGSELNEITESYTSGESFLPLIELLNRKYSGRNPSKKVRKSRVMLLLSVAYDTQCFVALEEGDIHKAIRFHNLAEVFFGMFLGATGEIFSENSIESIASKGADSRHAENRAMKSDVFLWLDKNFGKYTSMDSAAEAIAGKVVPIKFRAVRSWVGQWKKLRSAGKT